MISSLDALVPLLSSGFLLCIARDSLYNSRDQWSDLSIILQLSNISCVKLVSVVLEESGVSSIRVLICWKCSQELMWALISELSRVLCSLRRVKRQRSVLPMYELLQPGQEN